MQESDDEEGAHNLRKVGLGPNGSGLYICRKVKIFLIDFWNKCTHMGVSITSIGLENSTFLQYPKNE